MRDIKALLFFSSRTSNRFNIKSYSGTQTMHNVSFHQLKERRRSSWHVLGSAPWPAGEKLRIATILGNVAFRHLSMLANRFNLIDM
jgi:hypothetical protein